MKTARYVIIYLLVLQFAIPALIPIDWLYHYRMDYETVKNNPSEQIDTVLSRLKWEIERKGLKDYIIMLGDSVGYSGPGGPNQAINARMEQIIAQDGTAVPVFNLSMPAMQVGDLYVMLLKLDQHGIQTDRVITNLIYPGFIARTPLPPIVFWLADDLKRLDPEAYEHWEAHLKASKHEADQLSLPLLVRDKIGSQISLVRYRDFIKDELSERVGLLQKQEVYDTRPWHEKPGLKEALQTWEYQTYFSPQPFVMTDENPQIYFLERIFSRMTDAQVLVYLSPVNQHLMDNYVEQPGYQENIRRIDDWMAKQPVAFVNLERALDQALFADHLHLTPEGYEVLAARLWLEFKNLSSKTN